MAFDSMTDDMNIISKLPDEPNDEGGMTASALKATFDKAGTLAKTAINKLIAALGASTAAGNIGFARSTNVPADNVQDAIEDVQSQIAGVALGSIPDGSITAQQLAASAVTAGKIAPGAIEFVDVSNEYEIAAIKNATVINKEFRFVPALGIITFIMHIRVETEQAAWAQVVLNGPYTSRYDVYGEAVSASITDFDVDQDIGVSANITNFKHVVDAHMEDQVSLLLHISKAANCVVTVSGWFFAHEAEVS